jgi:hypothetical protein
MKARGEKVMDNSNPNTIETKARKHRLNGFDRMEAIAFGVRARFEESTGYLKKITDTTAQVARALGVPEKEIDKWIESQLSQQTTESQKLQEIRTLLEKYYGSVLGISV